MKTNRTLALIKRAAFLLLLSTINYEPSAWAQSTAFTYQGRLNDGGAPAEGIYDLRFTIYDSTNSPGTVVAGPLTNSPTGVSNGLFTVTLDPGAGVFNGADRWLEMAVRTNGSSVPFTTLNPRQPLTPAPYALYAPAAGAAGTAATATSVAPGSVTGAGIAGSTINSGNIASGQVVKSLNALKDDVTLAAGANIAITPNGNTLQLSASDATRWSLAGNAGTAAGVNFLGTTDNQPVELKANGQRILRLEPTTGAPNIIGGHSGNQTVSGVVGATVAGGGAPNLNNVVAANFASVLGGISNLASGVQSAVGGGGHNTASGRSAFIGGGGGFDAFGGGPYPNVASGDWSLVAGGWFNSALGYSSVIGGGGVNRVETNTTFSGIGGGFFNTLLDGSSYATIGGGSYNSIQTNAFSSTVGGGYGNLIQTDAFNSIIGGGYTNVIGTNSPAATIGGGTFNRVAPSTVATTVAGGTANNAGGSYATIGGGAVNTNNSPNSVIAGGNNNIIESFADFSSIGGGWLNFIQSGADQSVIPGGNANHILSGARESFIGGGFANTIQTNAAFSFIGAGTGNVIGTNSIWGTIAGGQDNSILTNAPNATIGGGFRNLAGNSATVAGGRLNKATLQFGTVAGGVQNTNTGLAATVGGGRENTSSTTYSTVGGGFQNFASGNFNGAGDSATVAGGYQNSALGNNAFVGGGFANHARGDNSAIVGGWLNTNLTGNGFVGGGESNLIERFSQFSVLSGGGNNVVHSNSTYAVISGGRSNRIATNASFAVIPGGFSNDVTAPYGFATGRRAKANHSGAFVWADSTDADFASTVSNQFNVRATGGVRLETSGAGVTVDGLPVVSGLVGTGQLADNSITTPKLQNNSVIAPQIAAGQVVKSLNGFRDDFTLLASGNIALIPAGNGLMIDSAPYLAGNGLQLVGNQFSLRPGSTLTNDQVAPYAFKGIAPPGVWAGPIGIWGQGGASAGVGPNLPAGVVGESGEDNGVGVWGFSVGTNAFSAGVYGRGFGLTTGTLGLSDAGNGVQGTSTFANGVQGSSSSTTASGVYGENLSGAGYGVAGRARTNGIAIYGENFSASGLAGLFNGNVSVSGNVTLTDATKGILFPATAGANAPMITMFASGIGNADRMVIAHSSGFSNYGLQYRDSTDKFNFLSAGVPVMTVDLATRRVGIGTDSPGSALEVIGEARATVFTPTSDRAAKENFEPVDAQEVLAKVAALPITRWNFKALPGAEHIGPVAQDFHVAFGVGTDDRHIATVDADGVALAAIQGLNQKMEEQRAELKQKETEITELKQTVIELKEVVQAISDKLNGGAR